MLIEENVLLQMRHLQTHAHVGAKLATNKIQLHGWTYNIGSGDVKAYDEAAFIMASIVVVQQNCLGVSICR